MSDAEKNSEVTVVDIEPNYSAMFQRFMGDSETLIKMLQHKDRAKEARSAREVLVSINIALQSVANTKDFNELRDRLNTSIGGLADWIDSREPENPDGR